MAAKATENMTVNPDNKDLFDALDKARPASPAPAPTAPRVVATDDNGITREDY